MASALKCCTNFWRILFLILNGIFAVIGLALVGLGIYLLASNNSLDFITGNQFVSGGALIIISGVVTFFIALIGIVGAAGGWPAVLVFYIILMLIVVILEIVAGVLGFVYRNDLERFVENRALDAIRLYAEGPASDVTQVVDFMQNTFMCCGYNIYEDWFNSSFFNTTNRFPDSCNCTNVSSINCMDISGAVPGQTQPIYERNCSSSVRLFLEENLIVVGAVGITFGVIELIGLAMSIGLCCCFCALRRNKDDDEYNYDKAV